VTTDVDTNANDIRFGQLSGRATATPGATWHAVKWTGEGWLTICSAWRARPGLRIVNIADKPGAPMCKLVRCQALLTGWRAEQGDVEIAPALPEVRVLD
jgi:hypothetical protein